MEETKETVAKIETKKEEVETGRNPLQQEQASDPGSATRTHRSKNELVTPDLQRGTPRSMNEPVTPDLRLPVQESMNGRESTNGRETTHVLKPGKTQEEVGWQEASPKDNRCEEAAETALTE